MAKSYAEVFKALPDAEREARMNALTFKEQSELLYEWDFWARPEQLPPTDPDYFTWLILAGRGWGKTRTGAEYIKERIRSGESKYIYLIGATYGDARDIMVEGESGLLNIYPEGQGPRFNKTDGTLTWEVGPWAPRGAKAFVCTSEEPERMRGKQADTAWLDELCSWTYPQETYDQMLMGLRLGKKVQCIITTTPKPSPLLKTIMRDPKTRITRGSTYDNSSNLADNQLEMLRTKYEGTRLGRQEIEAVVLDDNPGALWKMSDIDAARVTKDYYNRDDMQQVVVALDPAVTAKAGSDETGIIVVGLSRDKQAFVLEDVSGIYTPDEWGTVAMRLYLKHKASKIIAEVNQGGDMVQTLLQTIARKFGLSWFGYHAVRATKGKAVRAEPAAALYEQHKVHHVGAFPLLEEQMCDWNPQDTKTDSPDRMDALVWALTYLILDKREPAMVHKSTTWGLYG